MTEQQQDSEAVREAEQLLKDVREGKYRAFAMIGISDKEEFHFSAEVPPGMECRMVGGIEVIKEKILGTLDFRMKANAAAAERKATLGAKGPRVVR